jgi:hypothetical protein
VVREFDRGQGYVPAPGICVVCEGDLSGDLRLVDTERDMRVIDLRHGIELDTHVSGRKLLCRGCVVAAFNALLGDQLL